MIEREIDIGVRPRLVASDGPEQVEMLDAELSEFGFVLPQPATMSARSMGARGLVRGG